VIYIWIRRTVSWADDREALAQVTDPGLKVLIPLWNETFSMSYQRFRQRLVEIATINHSRVAGAVRAPWDEIPDGALVLPVDDDDWFAPYTAEVLDRERLPDVPAYVWPWHTIEIPVDLPKWLCGTNSYAMAKGPETREQLASHVAASRWFWVKLLRGRGTVKRIGRELSVQNRTLNSVSTLRTSVHDRATLLDRYRRYLGLYRTEPFPGPDWSRPYVEMMAALMQDLEPRA